MVRPTPEKLAELLDLHERGMSFQAYQQSQELGHPSTWEGTAARVLAGRLVMHWGTARLGGVLHALAFRADPQSPLARCYAAYQLCSRKGLYEGWRFVNATPDLVGADAEIRSSWFSLRGRLAAFFRDFDEAERLLDEATDIAPQSPWVWSERSYVLEMEDRYDEALAAGRRALELRAWYRPAVQQVAHLLTLREEEEAAVALLRTALEQIESSLLAAQLAAVLEEREQFAEAMGWMDRYVELTPLRDKKTEQWLAARRGDLAWALGRTRESLDWLKQSESPFHKHVVEQLERRLAETGATDIDALGRRVVLPVGFVRQHELTCAPATLATISRYWGRPAEHLSIAEQICYDGTPRFRGREWAEQCGCLLREFRVTWDGTRQLIDAGIPFTLTTVEPGNAHMQAVVGYDDRRATLLIRDPFQRLLCEGNAEALLERQRPFGPRGMAFVPADRPELVAALGGLDLPDVELNEWNHRLEVALVVHRRDQANQAYDEMRRLAADDPMTILARRGLARYDGDEATALECDNQMLAKFDEHPVLVRAKLGMLNDLARSSEQVELCRRMCRKKETPPQFWALLAGLLSSDARCHDEARHWLRRALRASPSDAAIFVTLADLLWSERKFDQAFDLYRLASGLDSRNESHADSYFRAARCLGRTAEALAALRRRYERFGTKSGEPARTLYAAYGQLERIDEAFEMLREAMTRRSDDGGLKLFAADAALDYGRTEWAAELLAAADGQVPRGAWLATAARQSALLGDPERALAAWREVAERDPLSVAVQVRISNLLAERDGPDAGLDYLRQLTERFPFHRGLHEQYILQLRDDAPERIESAARHMLEVHPHDCWARRELAQAVSQRGDLEAAQREIDTALEFDPHDEMNHVTKGFLSAVAGRRDEAREAFRRVIRMNVDNDIAQSQLLLLCQSTAERRAELLLIRDELQRQVTVGDGMLAFGEQARGTFEPEELVAILREGLAARPDLWHFWSAVVVQLDGMRRLDEALEAARQATERFPLLPKLWFDLAVVHGHRGELAAEQQALRKALEINPRWPLGVRALAESYERGHQTAEARALLERLARQSPLDGDILVDLTDLLVQAGEIPAAIDRLEALLRIRPGYVMAWSYLQDLTARLDQTERFEKLVRDVAEKRPHEASTWLMVARHLTEPHHLDERLAALDRVVAMRPQISEAYDLRAELLAGVHRYDEALAACRPDHWGDAPPIELRGRAAWVEWSRGRSAAAISMMKDVVGEYADYTWAWRSLFEWAVETSDLPLAREAAEKLVELTPHDNVAWGYLADARERAGELDGAVEAFTTALGLAPDYEFAAVRLFALHRRRSEFDAAQHVLDDLRAHVEGRVHEAFSIQLELSRGNPDAKTLDRARTLLCDRTAPAWMLDPVLNGLHEVWGSAVAARFLEKLILTSDGNPALGDYWINWLREAGHEPEFSLWRTMFTRGEVAVVAATRYGTDLARSFQPKKLKRFARRFRTELTGQTRTWAHFGWAMTCAEDFAAAAEWLQDWRQRPDLEPWMLSNLGQSLRAIGRMSEAHEVSCAGAALPLDNASRFHFVHLACDACTQRDFPAARQFIQATDPFGMHSDDRFLLSLIHAVLEYVDPDDGRLSVTAGSVRSRFDAIAREFRLIARTPPYRVAHRTLLRLIAASAKDWTTMWWAGSRIAWSHGVDLYDRLTWPQHAKQRAAGE